MPSSGDFPDAGEDATDQDPGYVIPSPDAGEDSGTTDAGKDSGKDAGKDAGDAGDAGKDAGAVAPDPGGSCTVIDQIASRTCGMCGTQKAICQPDDNGLPAWTGYGRCENEAGECLPGATQPCGNCGTRTCTNLCGWGACTGQPPQSCTPGAKALTQAGCPNGGYRSRICGTTCSWEPYSLSCDLIPTVAVMAAGSSGTDLQTKLANTGLFAVVDSFDVSGSGAPSLATMKNYDAIVTWTYLSVPTSFGDNLAQYLEAGGGVVLADYESQESGTWVLGGRYQTDYTVSTPISSSSWLTSKVTLGTINDPTSPIMAGVTKFGGADHLPTSAFNKNNPIVVASFSDGTPAVVRGVIKGRDVVEINSMGCSTGGNTHGWDPATDGARLFANALLYTIPSKPLTSPKQVDSGNKAVSSSSAPVPVMYKNVSSAPQTITALTLTGTNAGDFAMVPSPTLPVTVAPGDTFTVNVVFTPSATGPRSAALSPTITGVTNSPTTSLTGTGL